MKKGRIVLIGGCGVSSLALAIAKTLADSGIELIEATTEHMGEMSQNNTGLISIPILPQPKLIYDFKEPITRKQRRANKRKKNTNTMKIQNILHLIEQFGEWVKGLFQRSEAAYKVLTVAEKQFAEWSYGVVAIINANLDDLSPVLGLISTKYPLLSHDQLQGFLDMIIRDITLIDSPPLTLQEAIEATAGYLKGLQGQTWQTISQTIGNLLAILFSPETPVQKFIQASEYIYRMIVKPHVEGR